MGELEGLGMVPEVRGRGLDWAAVEWAEAAVAPAEAVRVRAEVYGKPALAAVSVVAQVAGPVAVVRVAQAQGLAARVEDRAAVQVVLAAEVEAEPAWALAPGELEADQAVAEVAPPAEVGEREVAPVEVEGLVRVEEEGVAELEQVRVAEDLGGEAGLERAEQESLENG